MADMRMVPKEAQEVLLEVLSGELPVGLKAQAHMCMLVPVLQREGETEGVRNDASVE